MAKTFKTLEEVTIRFAGDSGDGMQLTGTQFTNTAAALGNDLSTLPDYPAEIRAPAGTTYGVSGFQIKFGSTDILTPGDSCDVLVAMNPAALVTNIKIDGEAIGAFGDGEFWFHIDSGYTARPYKYTFLFALELPSEGGNTLFSNMYKAYEAVPDELKRKLKGRRALHIHEYNRNRQASHAGDISLVPHHYHPVFTTHPDTGRKSLFVDRLMTTSLEGFSEDESAAILDRLYDIGERREFIYEHVWRPGDFLMWDNRCTIHARTDFPKNERRLLRRCAVEGGELYE